MRLFFLADTARRRVWPVYVVTRRDGHESTRGVFGSTRTRTCAGLVGYASMSG